MNRFIKMVLSMTQISKYSIKQDLYNEILNIFVRVISGLRSEGSVKLFLNEFLSPTEKIMLAKRMAVGIFVAKGYGYKEIGDALKMSTSTIAEYALAYKYKDGYKEIINKILRNKIVEKHIYELIEGFAEIELLGNSKSKGWLEVKNDVQNKRKYKII